MIVWFAYGCQSGRPHFMRAALSRRSVLIGATASVLVPRRVRASTVRATPAGFNSIGVRPVSVKRGCGPGRIELSHTPQQLALERNPQRNPTCGFIDEIDGTDLGSGSSQSPFGSIDYAAANSEFDNFIVRKGDYAPPTQNVNDPSYAKTGPRLKQFFLSPGVNIVTPGPNLQSQRFVHHYGSVYKTILPFIGEQTVDRVIFHGDHAQGGQFVSLTKFDSPETLMSSGQPGWNIFSTVGEKELSIRLPYGLDAEKFKKNIKVYYLDADKRSNWSIRGVQCAIYARPNTVVFDGVSLIATDVGGFQSEIYAEGIYSRFAQESAFQTFGGVNYFKRCIAYAPWGDCFNYNSSTTFRESDNVEHDCQGYNAGDIDTFGINALPISNGSSVHEWVNILRAGCVFGRNWGPQIADIANAGSGISWNIGVDCGPTTEPQSIGFYSSDAGRSSIWDQCRSRGNKTAISSTGGVGKSYDCDFDGAIVGKIAAYDPFELAD